MKKQVICGKEINFNMTTTIRPELSKKNKYWIERHRYYELKHFCLQYPIWKKTYLTLDSLSKRPDDFVLYSNNGAHGDPTARCAKARLFYSDRMDMIENAAKKTDESLSCFILKAVTEGLSYDYLRLNLGIPCCKDVYYDLYRRFFWLLNKIRQ